MAEANYFAAIPKPEDVAERRHRSSWVRGSSGEVSNHPLRTGPRTITTASGRLFHRVARRARSHQRGRRGRNGQSAVGESDDPLGAESVMPRPLADADRRVAFAGWLTARGNPFFARAAVNRIWAHLFGRGIVDPVDDFRSSNPPSNVELLDRLAGSSRKADLTGGRSCGSSATARLTRGQRPAIASIEMTPRCVHGPR
ncbi:MAG: hypothetical protein CM1200mP2_55430 [Planctomycetaceae bacterium]|nr:MAG: hypothetical protein CM1200mP2_55430 [Planctomycetaceae bacterium]